MSVLLKYWIWTALNITYLYLREVPERGLSLHSFYCVHSLYKLLPCFVQLSMRCRLCFERLHMIFDEFRSHKNILEMERQNSCPKCHWANRRNAAIDSCNWQLQLLSLETCFYIPVLRQHRWECHGMVIRIFPQSSLKGEIWEMKKINKSVSQVSIL